MVLFFLSRVTNIPQARFEVEYVFEFEVACPNGSTLNHLELPFVFSRNLENIDKLFNEWTSTHLGLDFIFSCLYF